MSVSAEVQLVANALAGALNPDNTIRSNAEKTILEMEKNPGYIPCILTMLMMRNELPIFVRQGAVLRLKNLVKYGWHGRRAKLLHPQDRVALQQQIISVICSETEWIINVQLLEVLFQVLRCDYPKEWPTAFDQIMVALQSANSTESMFGAVACFNIICKVFRHASNREDKLKMNYFISSGMPLIFSAFESIVRQNTPIALQFCKLVLKTFSYAIQVSIPDYFLAFENMDKWVAILLTLLGSSLDPAVEAAARADPEQMRQNPAIKLRKWALKVLYRLFSDTVHIRVSPAEKKKHNLWIKKWSQRYGASLVTTVVTIVNSQKTGHFVAPKIWLQCFNILKHALLKGALYTTLIKPNMANFIENGVFPTLLLTSRDLEVWQEDPHGFVAQNLDPLSSMGDHRYAAERFLENAVRTRTKTVLPIVLNLANSVFTAYDAAVGEAKVNLVLSKDAALRMLVCIKKHLIEKHAKLVEDIIIHHVFPEFAAGDFSPNAPRPPVLVVRGLSFIAAFAKCPFSTPDILLKTVEFACNSLGAHDLTLRVEAGQTLGKLVRNVSIREALRPNLSLLFDRLLALINEVSNETLGLLFRDLLEHFEADLAPFAERIVSHLVPMFIHCASATGDDDETEESLLAASQYLASIVGIVMSLEEAPQLLPTMERLCEPMVTLVLQGENIDYIDGVLSLFQCYTYYPKQISDYTWAHFPILINACLTWATDYMENFAGPLVNYFSNDMAQFMARPEYVSMLLTIPTHYFSDEDRNAEASYVAHVLRTLLGYATKGELDSYFPGLVKMLMDKLVSSKQDYLKQIILDCLCAMLHNSLELFLSTLINQGTLDTFFNYWFSIIEHMRDEDRVTYSIHALSKLIETVPAAQMPPSLRSQMRVVVGKLLESMLQLKDITERRKLQEAEEEDEENDERDIFDVDSDFDDDDDELGEEAGDDTANTMQTTLNNLSADARAEITGDREELGATWEGYTTPIDDLNPFSHFLNAMNVFRERDGANYADFAQSVFSPESPTMDIFKFAQAAAIEFDTVEEDDNESSQ